LCRDFSIGKIISWKHGIIFKTSKNVEKLPRQVEKLPLPPPPTHPHHFSNGPSLRTTSQSNSHALSSSLIRA
jgi:hypothetical protein